MKTILKLLFVIGYITCMYQIYFVSQDYRDQLILEIGFGLMVISLITLTLSKCFKKRDDLIE